MLTNDIPTGALIPPSGRISTFPCILGYGTRVSFLSCRLERNGYRERYQSRRYSWVSDQHVAICWSDYPHHGHYWSRNTIEFAICICLSERENDFRHCSPASLSTGTVYVFESSLKGPGALPSMWGRQTRLRSPSIFRNGKSGLRYGSRN